MQLMTDTDADVGEDLSFDWYIHDVKEDKLFIQIVFVNPTLISSRGTTNDYLLIVFKDLGVMLTCQHTSESSSGGSRRRRLTSYDIQIESGYNFIVTLPSQDETIVISEDMDLEEILQTTEKDETTEVATFFAFSSATMSILNNMSM